MKIAVEGCAHGELDRIYESINKLEKDNNIKVDLLIICGDFQAVRNPTDLKCMAVPPKYQKLNTFYKYYSGEVVAPLLTIFIGGNHEASNYLSELYYGGWVCPNIYYMGCANVLNIGGVRIAGLSGIYKSNDYLKGHYECPPYDQNSKRSVYHVRNVDVFRLKQLQKPVDICVSHDWPKGVYNSGNKEELLRWKPFFRDEMNKNELGSPPAEELLYKLKPSYWFAAHLHCKFSALVPHAIDGKRTFTKFLALDKCLPRRKFLQVLDIGDSSTSPCQIKYDPEWLCILKSTDHLLSTTKRVCYMPGPGSGCSEQWDFTVTDPELETVKNLFNDDFSVPENFETTAPPHKSASMKSNNTPKPYINPQTTKFCRLLQVKDPFANITNNLSESSLSISEFSFNETSSTYSNQTSFNPDEISLSDSDSIDNEIKLSTESNENETESPDISNNMFFIDKKRISGVSGDSLDTQTSDESYQCSTPVSNMKPKVIDFNFPELKDENQLTDVVDSSEKTAEENEDIPVKKFKRRNQSLYTNIDED